MKNKLKLVQPKREDYMKPAFLARLQAVVNAFMASRRSRRAVAVPRGWGGRL